MRLKDVIGALGAYCDDAVMITEAEPLDAPGPRILWCNEALSRHTGYGADEVIGRSPRIFQGPGTDRAVARRIGERLRRWAPVREDVLNYRKDGSPFWTDLSIRPVADERGWFRFWVAVQRDVTERKAHEEGHVTALAALRRRAASEAEVIAQLDGLGRHAPGALYQIRIERDGARRLSYWSATLPELMGLDPAAVGLRAVMETVHPADLPGLRAAILAAEASHALLDTEYRVRHRERGERWLRSVSAPRRAADGATLWDGHLLDVTDHRRALAELEAARASAEAASAAKSRFLATISHELRTPLNGVLGMAALMDAGPLDADQRDRLAVIRRSGEALLGLLGDMLDLVGSDDEVRGLVAEPFALAELARRIDGLNSHRARAKALDFAVMLAAAPGAQRIGDLDRATQLVHKLVDNAIKFTDAGAVAVRILDGRAGDEALLVEVRDTGAGIDPEQCARLFEPFAQGEEGATRRRGGAGVGLALAGRLARAMGGGLTVQSAPGEGSTFSARLPLPRAAAA